MSTATFLNIPGKERVNIFNQISADTRMPPFAVEKDWWVVQTLSTVFNMTAADHLLFKGGTSLSKAWQLIQRFSEDIDLAIDRSFLGFPGELSKNQRTKLRKAAGAYTAGPFLAELQQKFIEKGIDDIQLHLVEAADSDQDPRIIEVRYPNLITPSGYMEPKVQIEVGCRSLWEPYSARTFGSLIDEHYAGSDFVNPFITIPVVNPERTFLEKVFLLHEEFQRPQEKVRVSRLSRHLYDVVKLAQSPFAEKALADQALYSIIVEHRQKFVCIAEVNYNLHQPQTINPIPIPEKIEEWKADYKTMIEEMIYEEKPPSFDEIISDLMNLKNKINALPWKFEKEYPIPNSQLK